MSSHQSNGRLEWLKQELKDMEMRITARIDRLEAATTQRLNDHAARLKALEHAESEESGARKYKRWLIATAFGLVGAVGALVGMVATVLGGSRP